ncbi:FGGY family carbohydrate kinase [Bradyrhizobium sp. CCGUVB4N]|uniref:FGGY family carbohydrate kinase n=1 Tax=Bradyrhizobium sp. CCGUVB4N TaxID=2949631 RepID=UPI0020B1C9A1|nr:FGGY family carbohydrate kinase [Bradyrhizobium sp. CCGUVB4N]MCP3384582.1 FGGY family carbohydrate kinase [Bradyrhizobium sp. CCGUVB4N]
MADILLVDFGTSRVKSVVVSTGSYKVLDEAQTASPVPSFGPAGEVEISPEGYWAALEATAGALASRHPKVAALWLCSELHGVIVADAAGLPVTPYISWRDGRASSTDASGSSIFDRISASSERLLSLTGMRVRPGLPVSSLAHLAAHRRLAERFRIFTLPDWLLWRGGERDPGVHVSMAAGTGLYDLTRRSWSPQLAALAGLGEFDIAKSRIVPMGEMAGRIRLAGLDLPVFGCLGDVQSTAAGTGFPKVAKVVINLGTGSQVLFKTATIPPDVERRPGADGAEFAAIPFIPSGRALSVFAELLDGSAVLGGGKPFFWSQFAELSAAEVLEAALDVDLNVFEAAWRYRGGGAISAIREGGLSARAVMSAIAKAWLAQYILAMDHLDPDRHEQTVLVSGGLSRRAQFILPVLAALSGRTPRLAETASGEETLDGLLALSRAHTPAS